MSKIDIPLIENVSIALTDDIQKGTASELGISLCVLVVWAVVAWLYFSRILGLIISVVGDRLIKFSGTEGSFSIGSLSLNPLAGTLCFRRLIFANENASIRLNDGFIELAYWSFLSNKKPAKSASSRLGVQLNGLQIHIYNQVYRYRAIAKLLRLADLLPTSAAEDSVFKTPATAAEHATGAGAKPSSATWDRVWSLIGHACLNISSGRIVIGNELLPYMFVVSFENSTVAIRLDESLHDENLLSIHAQQMENVRATLVKHPEYKAPPGVKVPEPPRTMGDNSFVLMQTAELEFFYIDDILGLEKAEQQSLDEHRPVYESIIRCKKSTQFAYGPWAENQRAAIVQFFFPPTYDVTPVTELPKKGSRRIKVLHDLRMLLMEPASLSLYFMRGDNMEVIESRIGKGSSIEAQVWWVTTENGFRWTTKGSLLEMESWTTLVHSPFLNCETFSFEVSAQYPRAANAKQNWQMTCLLSKATLFFVSEHIPFISDLMSEWVGDVAADLTTFVPYILTIDVTVQDFEIVLIVNEANWLRRGGPPPDENWQAALVGQKLRINAVLPFDDFAPELVRVTYEIHAAGELALRASQPPQRVSCTLLAALLAAAPTMNARRSRYGTRSVNPAEWAELWRSEAADIVLEHAYHPQPGTFVSELPPEVLSQWISRPPDHPFHLTPDLLSVQIELHSSELLFSGVIIRLVTNFIENYCSSYDVMTDVAGGEEAEQRMKPSKAGLAVEKLRPLSVILAARIHHIRAFCLSHAAQSTSDCVQIISEQIEVEVDKNFERSLIQVSVGGCGARLGDGAGASASPAGFVSLSSLQVRGHALFSPLGVPTELASLEYAWTLQILVGDITGCLSPAQLVQVVELITTILAIALADDDEARLPARLAPCQHGQLPTQCRAAGRQPTISGASAGAAITTVASGIAPVAGRRCPSGEQLQFRFVRLSLDSARVLVVDDTTALHLELESARFRYCNWQSRHVGLSLRRASARLLVSAQGDHFQEAARSFVDDIDIKLKLREDGEEDAAARVAFVRSHDEATKRLPFVWEPKTATKQKNGRKSEKSAKAKSAGSNKEVVVEIEEDESGLDETMEDDDEVLEGDCACAGKLVFFGGRDVVGRYWSNGAVKLAVLPNEEDGYLTAANAFSLETCIDTSSPLTRRDYSERGQLRYMESVLRRGRKACQPLHKSVYKKKHSIDNPSLWSFHSFSNETRRDAVVAYEGLLPIYKLRSPGEDFPELGLVGEIDRWIRSHEIKLERKSKGIEDVRLLLPISSSDKEVEDKKEKRSDVFDLHGALAKKFSLLLTPLGLGALEELGESIEKAARVKLRSAWLPQAMYSGCASKFHQQPILEHRKSSALRSPVPSKGSLLDHLIVNLRLPQVDVTFLAATPPSAAAEATNTPSSVRKVTPGTPTTGMHSSSLPSFSPGGPHPTMVILTADQSRIGTKRDAEMATFTFSMNALAGHIVLLSKLNEEDKVTFRKEEPTRVSERQDGRNESGLYGRVEMRHSEEWPPGASDSRFHANTVLELHVPGPNVVFKFARRSQPTASTSTAPPSATVPHDRLHLLQAELKQLDMRLVYGEAMTISNHDPAFPCPPPMCSSHKRSITRHLEPSLNTWLIALAKTTATIEKITNRLSAWRDWRLARLLHLAYAEREQLMHCSPVGAAVVATSSGTGVRNRKANAAAGGAAGAAASTTGPRASDLAAVRKHDGLQHCASCALSLALLRFCATSASADWDDVKENMRRDSVARKDILKEALRDWQPFLATIVSLPVGMDSQMFELEESEKEHKGERERETGGGANGTSATPASAAPTTSAMSATAQGNRQDKEKDLYHYVQKAVHHKQKSGTDKKKKGSDNKGFGRDFDPHVFFYAWYQGLKLDQAKVDTIHPINMKVIFQLHSVKMETIESRYAVTSLGARFVSLSAQPALALDGISASADVQVQRNVDRRLALLPSSGSISIQSEAHVRLLEVQLVLQNLALLGQMGLVIRNAVRAYAAVYESSCKPNGLQVVGGGHAETPEWAGNLIKRVAARESLAQKRSTREERVPLEISASLNSTIERVKVESTAFELCAAAEVQHLKLSLKVNSQGKRVEIKSDGHTRRAQLNVIRLPTGGAPQRANHLALLNIQETRMDARKPQTSQLTSITVGIGNVEGEIGPSLVGVYDIVEKYQAEVERHMQFLAPPTPMAPCGQETDLSKIPALAVHSGTSIESVLPQQPPQQASEIALTVKLNSVQLAANPTPSVRTSFRMEKARADGRFGPNLRCKLRIEQHTLTIESETGALPELGTNFVGPIPREALRLPLPAVTLQLTRAAEPAIPSQSYQGQYPYLAITLTIDPLRHTFPTDVLNLALFVEVSLRNEVKLLLDKLAHRQAATAATKTAGPFKQAVNPPQLNPPTTAEKQAATTHFALKVESKGAPWLCLTAKTPTGTAVRLQIINLNMTLSNREKKIGTERLRGSISLMVQLALGQLTNAEHLDDFAKFETEVNLERKDGTTTSDAINALLKAPVCELHPRAVERAVLLWLHCKASFEHWAGRRQLPLPVHFATHDEMTTLTSQRTVDLTDSTTSVELPHSQSQGAIPSALHDLVLSLLITDLSLRIPLRPDTQLVLMLKTANGTLSVHNDLDVGASFTSFTIAIVEATDKGAVELPVVPGDKDVKHGGFSSNFISFPSGQLHLTSAVSRSMDDGASMRVVVHSNMEGMVMDMDQRIGRLTKVLISAFTSLGDPATSSCVRVMDEGGGARGGSAATGAFHGSTPSLASLQSSVGSSSNVEEELKAALKRLPSMAEKQKYLEKQKMNQLALVNDMKELEMKDLPKEQTKLAAIEQAQLALVKRELMNRLGGKSDVEEKKRGAGGGRGSLLSEELPPKLRPLTERVKMRVEATLTVNNGRCTLRTAPTQIVAKPSFPSELPRLVTLTAVTQPYSTATELSIPGVKGAAVFSPGGSSPRGTLHVDVSLEAVNAPTTLTPHIASFIEQVLEPLPTSWSHARQSDDGDDDGSATRGRRESCSSVSSAASATVAVVGPSHLPAPPPPPVMDTAAFPFDMIIAFQFRPSTIIFNGQQHQRLQKAADCELQLPELSVAASTRLLPDGRVSLDLSATLMRFRLRVYSPLQATGAPDALSLSLDQLAFVISRSKNSSTEPENRVEVGVTASVGRAAVDYDMRRLDEIFAFPKPWYRASVARRLFFGDRAATPHHPAPPSHSAQESAAATVLEEAATLGFSRSKRWHVKVVLGMQWRELEMKAQMGSVMGMTIWKAEKGQSRVVLQMATGGSLCLDGMFGLDASDLSATQAAVVGEVILKGLRVDLSHRRERKKPPQTRGRISLASGTARIDWMKNTCLIVDCLKPSVAFMDAWKHTKDPSNPKFAIDARIETNVSLCWERLHLVITRTTIIDLESIALKLVNFFKSEFNRKRWDLTDPSRDHDRFQIPRRAETPTSATAASSSRKPGIGHWPRLMVFFHALLDKIIPLQLADLIPIPSNQGKTTLLGNFSIAADDVSVACMTKDLSSPKWALFHLSHPSIQFSTRCATAFAGSENVNFVKDKPVLSKETTEEPHPASSRKSMDDPTIDPQPVAQCIQRLQLHLGEEKLRDKSAKKEEKTAGCRLVGSVASVSAKTPGTAVGVQNVRKTLETLIIGPLQLLRPSSSREVLTGLSHSSKSRGELASQLEVTELFQLPPIDAVLDSLQEERFDSGDETEESEREQILKVLSRLVAQFYGTVNVQTDLKAQADFLLNLFKAFNTKDTMGGPASAEKEMQSAVTVTGSASTSKSFQSGVPGAGGISTALPPPSSTDDRRQHRCSHWEVHPKIAFIDNYKWKPPVLDEVLRLFKIYEYNTTVPKVLQRAVMDPLDVAIAHILKELLAMAEKST